MKIHPSYDIDRSYEENYRDGPFFSEMPPARKIIRKKSFLGFEVNSYFGVPAGPLLNARWITTYAALGFDLLVYKTVRTVATPSHPNPNCLFLDCKQQLKEADFSRRLMTAAALPLDSEKISITNSFGMPSRGPDVWQADVETARKGLRDGQLLIVSVVGTPGRQEDLAADYVEGAKMAVEAGAPVIEINLSCPNVVSREGSLFTDPIQSSRLSRAVKKAIGAVPLIIKVGYIADPSILNGVVAANAPHVDAISGINTLSFEVVNQEGKQALPGKGRLRAGVCGAAIRDCGLDQVSRIVDLKRQKKYDFSIVGVGGVMNPAHIDTFFARGADAVMSATGAMWDPLLAYKWWIKTSRHTTYNSIMEMSSAELYSL